MSTGDATTGTRLNAVFDEKTGEVHVPAPSGGGDGGGAAGGGTEPDLEMHDAELKPIGDDAQALRTQLSAAYGASGSSYEAVPDLSAAGLDSGSALRHSTQRFFRQATNLRNDCLRIEEHMGVTISSHAEQEAAILAELQRIQDALPPSGGGGMPGPAPGELSGASSGQTGAVSGLEKYVLPDPPEGWIKGMQ
ncbi:hypothetical protein GCM10009716_29820 [Streptomyces sodiiphilus]|uniref:Uncharacterized protein n=1 Tax=Streptomyces sodiiphilus TaxID=226217 RepID=A0ABN2PDQ2_9ACTN